MNLTPGQAEAIEAVHLTLDGETQIAQPQDSAAADAVWRAAFRAVLQQVAAAFPKETP